MITRSHLTEQVGTRNLKISTTRVTGLTSKAATGGRRQGWQVSGAEGRLEEEEQWDRSSGDRAVPPPVSGRQTKASKHSRTHKCMQMSTQFT